MDPTRYNETAKPVSISQMAETFDKNVLMHILSTHYSTLPQVQKNGRIFVNMKLH